MSIKVMSMVWDARIGNAVRKMVALKLADYANDYGGDIFPSLGTIARQVECDRSTVKRHIKSLMDDETLVRKHVGKGGNKTDTSRYQFNLPRLLEMAKDPGHQQPGLECTGGTGTPQPGLLAPPNPSVNHQYTSPKSPSSKKGTSKRLTREEKQKAELEQVKADALRRAGEES